MNLFKKIFCRVYQFAFHAALPVLPYREPVILKSTDEIIVSIGSGIAVKKDADGAREILTGQKEDLKDSLDKMLANLQQVTDVVGSLQAQAEQIAAAAQGNMSQMG